MSSNKIKVGPIRKVNTRREITKMIRKQANMMKIGEAFDVTGISNKTDLHGIRCAISYASKIDGFQVETRFKKGVLSVEKVGY